VKTALAVARTALGLVFLVAGISELSLIPHPPPIPGLAGSFIDVSFMLAKCYVPFALPTTLSRFERIA